MILHTRYTDQRRYVHLFIDYAFLPKRTKDSGWTWLTKIWKVVDERPLVFMGLFEEIEYFKSRHEAVNYYDYLMEV